MKGEEFYVPEDYMSLILELLNEFKIGLKVRTYDSMISALEEKLELEKNNKEEKRGIEEEKKYRIKLKKIFKINHIESLKLF